MAYENIDTASLRAALNDCLNTIDYSSSSSIISGLTDGVWMGNSKNNLVGALDRLVNTRYKNVEDAINHYLSVADAIDIYQNANNNLNSLESQKSEKEQQLKIEQSKSNKNQSKIDTLQNEIDSLTTQINNQKNQMNEITIDI